MFSNTENNKNHLIWFFKLKKIIPPIFFSIITLFITLIFLFGILEIGFRIYYHKTGKILAVDEEEKCLKDILRMDLSDREVMISYDRKIPRDDEYSNILGRTVRNNLSVMKSIDSEYRSGIPNTKVRVMALTVKTNSQHMRAIKDFDYKKPLGTIRIALLGDSFTWGSDSIQIYTYANILESLIPNSEVLNFGIKGSGIDNMYLRWKYEALNFKPDVVVMAIFADDIQRIQPCIKKPKFEIDDGKLIITNMPPPSFEEIQEHYEEPKFESYFLKHIIYNLKYFKGVTRTQYDYGFDILPIMLDEIKTKSEEDGTFFMVAIIDAHMGIYGEYEEEAVKRLKSILNIKKIPYMDMFETFKYEGVKNLTDINLYAIYKGLGHLSPIGNALFAQGIKNKIEEYGVIQKQKDYYFYYNPQQGYSLIFQDKKNSLNRHELNPIHLTFFNEHGIINPPGDFKLDSNLSHDVLYVLWSEY